MYANLICAGALLLEAAMLYVLLRGRAMRWVASVPLALAVVALTLAYRLWELYWQVVVYPTFPPGWFDGDLLVIGSSATPYRLLSAALALSMVLVPLLARYMYVATDVPEWDGPQLW